MSVRRLVVLALASIAVLSAVPAEAAATRIAGPSKGTWTFTDFSPDPTSTPEPAEMHCHGQLPSAPGDVNEQKVKIAKTGYLTLTGHNQLDWAMEVRNAAGDVLMGTDGSDVNTPEGGEVYLTKGTYSVVYCNLEGEPEITVDWSFKR
jgi:hypothetical protein